MALGHYSRRFVAKSRSRHAMQTHRIVRKGKYLKQYRTTGRGARPLGRSWIVPRLIIYSGKFAITAWRIRQRRGPRSLLCLTSRSAGKPQDHREKLGRTMDSTTILDLRIRRSIFRPESHKNTVSRESHGTCNRTLAHGADPICRSMARMFTYRRLLQ